MICSRCSSDNSEDAKFCNSCGLRLHANANKERNSLFGLFLGVIGAILLAAYLASEQQQPTDSQNSVGQTNIPSEAATPPPKPDITINSLKCGVKLDVSSDSMLDYEIAVDATNTSDKVIGNV